jgi:hypothetical protein
VSKQLGISREVLSSMELVQSVGLPGCKFVRMQRENLVASYEVTGPSAQSASHRVRVRIYRLCVARSGRSPTVVIDVAAGAMLAIDQAAVQLPGRQVSVAGVSPPTS